MDTADLADLYRQRHAAFARRRTEIDGRLYRVHRAMLRWEEWQDEQEKPADRRREQPTPVLSYDALEGLRALLLEKLAEVGTRAAQYRAEG